MRAFETGAAMFAAAERFLALPLRMLIWLYRNLVSPALPRCCRYYPSCSGYAQEALTRHGVFRGIWLAARRLLRCHPWCEGGFDPVPAGGAHRRPVTVQIPRQE